MLTSSAASMSIPSREECIRIAQEHSPEIQAAKQGVEKAKAGLSAAKDAYIPDITGLARYSYQSGIPFLVHNFGTFGFTFTYDLFDGGKRVAEIKDSQTVLSEAELNLTKVEDEVAVQVETAYDKVEQLQDLVGVAAEALKAREEASRVTDRRFEQTAAARFRPLPRLMRRQSPPRPPISKQPWACRWPRATSRRTMGQLPR